MAARPLVVPTHKDPFRFKLLLLGEPATGKSSIAHRWAEDSFTEQYEATIGMDFFAKDMGRLVVDVWEISGHPEFTDMRRNLYRETRGVCLVYDITVRSTFEALDTLLLEAYNNGVEKTYLYHAVAGNKLDLKGRRVVSRQEAEAWCVSRRFSYFEMSASTGEGVGELFQELSDQARLGP